MEKISVIIPFYNRKDSLLKMLDQFISFGFDQRFQYEVEFCIVDDGSADGVSHEIEKMLSCFPYKCKYLIKENEGAAAARNFGISKTTGDIVLFLDSDIIPSKDLFLEHISFHKLYSQENYVLRGSTQYLDCEAPTIRRTETGLLPSVNGEKYIKLKWADFITSNISIKRTYFLKTDGFDVQLRTREDVELGHRLSRFNMRLFHCNEAFGYHVHPVSVEQYFSYARSYGSSLAIWHNKSPELVVDLRSISREDEFGFFSARSLRLIVRYIVKNIVTNWLTIKIILLLGDVLEKMKLPCYVLFYHQAYNYYSRLAYIDKKRELKRSANT